MIANFTRSIERTCRRFLALQQNRCISQCVKHVVESPRESRSMPNSNLAEFVMSQWHNYGESLALVSADSGQKYTYSQLTDAVRSLAHHLTKLGLKTGDVVFLFGRNCPDYAVVYLAVVSIGAVVTTNNPAYTSAEVAQAVKLSNSKLVITDSEAVGTVAHALELLKEDNPVQEMIVLGEHAGYRPLSSLITKDFSTVSPPQLDWTEHIAALPFSSGTTGLPKGVMLSHNNIASNIIQIGSAVQVGPEDTLSGVLPLFHIYGQVATLLCGLYNGTSIVMVKKFEFPSFLESLQQYRVTLAHLVPPIILGMTKSNLTEKYDLSSLGTITSGAAPLKTSQSLEFAEKMKRTELLQGYGLTETSPVVTFNGRDSTNLHGSIGQALCDVKVKVVDLETNESLPANKEGELYFQGPNIMKGYFRNQEATDDCLDGTWFRTGDIGYYDENGYFYVVDRLKELIKYKGFQVAPAELEALLLTHPKIADTAVVSIPSEEAGELPRAYVVMKPGEQLSDTEVQDFVKANVASHKQLRGGVRQVPEIPKSASGKILRRLLRDEALKDM